MPTKKPKLSVVSNDTDDNRELVDGRRQRSKRSKEKILKAMWELMLDGDMDPSPAKIAKKAGVGLRSVFRHFEDIDTLHRELCFYAESEISLTIMKPLRSTKWKDQIVELVDRDVELWDRILVPHTAGEIRRFNSEVLMEDYQRSRMKELSQIKAILPRDIDDYKMVLHGLDSIISFSTVRRLRQDRNMSLNQTKAVMKHMVEAIVKDAAE